MFSSLEVPTVELGGVNISRFDFDTTMQWIEGRLQRNEFTQVATANMDFLNLCSNQPRVKEILNRQCHLVTADGMPLLWLARAVGLPIRERVAGSDMLAKVAAVAARLKLRVFFLGGDARVTPAAVRVLREQIPNLRVAGMNCERFDENDPKKVGAIVEEIRLSRADVLFVALGCPKQERFIAHNREQLNVRFAMGVGGTFDFIAGFRRRAPRWMQRVGMEWACRMIQEPRRLAPRYMNNLVCLARLTAMAASSRIFQH